MKIYVNIEELVNNEAPHGSGINYKYENFHQNKELERCIYASNQGEQLKKVALLVGKYSDRELSIEDIADLILWNCVDIFSIDA